MAILNTSRKDVTTMVNWVMAKILLNMIETDTSIFLKV